LLRSIFWGCSKWGFNKSGSKLDKERRISEIRWFLNYSAISVGGIKKLFNFLSAVESSVIEEAIKILVIYIEYKERIKRNNKK